MPEAHGDRPVKVTSDPRRHPAIRKLARACIALARWQREQETSELAAPAEESKASRANDSEPNEEERHD